MADNTSIAFGLKIDGVEQSIKSVKDLKSAIKSLQDEAEGADIGSEQYKNAIENIEKLNEKLQEVTRTEKQAAKATEDLANAEQEAAKETGDLRKQFEKLEDELFMLAGQGKQNTKEFRDLSAEAANLNAKIDEVNQTLGSGSSGIDKLGASFGMLSEGLTSMNFDKIKTGFKGLGSAMNAVPLMLLVSGITMLMEKFDVFGKITEVITDVIYAFTDAIGLTNKADEKAAAAIVENAQKIQTAKEQQYDAEIKKAQAAGQSTKQLELDKLKSTEDSIAKQVQAMEDLQNKKGKLNDEEQKNYDELQVNLLKASSDREAKEIANNKAKVDEINAYNTFSANVAEDLRVAKLSEREKEIDAIRKASAAKLKELNDKEVFDFNQSGKAIEEQLRKNKETEKQINELAQIEINKINAKYGKEAADKKKEQNEKNKADLDKRNEEYLKSQQDELAALKQRSLTEDLLRQKEREDYFNLEELKRQDKNKNRLLDAELNALNNKEDVDAQIALLETKRQIELQNLELTSTERAIINKKYADQEDELAKAAAEKEKALEKKKQDEIVKIIEDSLGTAQNLSNIFFDYKKSKAEKGSKEEMELAKKQFNVNKALQLGFALMDSYKAVTASLAQAPLAIGPAPNPAGIASLAFAITTSAANIAKIASAKFESGGGATGGGGGAAPMPSIPAPPTIATSTNNTNQSTTFDESGKNLEFKQPQINVTATVGVDEIASKSNRVSVLENQSTF